MNRHLIVLAEFGSAVYGTAMPSSDKDYKGVFLPTADEILLQRVPKSIVENTKKNSTEKNTSNDVDRELWSVQYYLKLLMENQVPCLDLLFVPEKHIIQQSEVWEAIRRDKDKYLCNNVVSFVSYAKQQASKYGLKGFRVAAFKAAWEWISQLDDNLTLWECNVQELVTAVNNPKYLSITQCKGPNGENVPHIEIGGKKLPFHNNVKYAKERIKFWYDEYGERARLAEKNLGVDLKATYHAVRVARQAEELLLTGNITFPRPEIDLLMKIRRGEMSYKEIEPIIEEGLERVETAKSKSVLRNEPDREYAEDFVKELHGSVIK